MFNFFITDGSSLNMTFFNLRKKLISVQQVNIRRWKTCILYWNFVLPNTMPFSRKKIFCFFIKMWLDFDCSSRPTLCSLGTSVKEWTTLKNTNSTFTKEGWHFRQGNHISFKNLYFLYSFFNNTTLFLFHSSLISLPCSANNYN
jgi:hypothetical protein